MERAAAATGQTAAEIAARWTAQWEGDRRRLGCLEPDVVPRAADHIAEQIEMIRTLEAGGPTYVIDEGVHFAVSTFPDYASFAGLTLDELTPTGRLEHRRRPLAGPHGLAPHGAAPLPAP